MNDFISSIRNDRDIEIKERESKGIVIFSKPHYRIIDTVEVLLDENTYTFGVHANNSEVYFYIINNGANTYYSIIELYELLKLICDRGNDAVVFEALENIAKMDTVHKYNKDGMVEFLYRERSYYINKIEYPEYSSEIEAPDGAAKISYIELFLLITLIQEKSNALFNRGSGNNEQYLNGLARLLYCLLKLDKDHEYLSNLGWYYSEEKELFELYRDKSQEEKRKYYLTEAEYMSIINEES